MPPAFLKQCFGSRIFVVFVSKENFSGFLTISKNTLKPPILPGHCFKETYLEILLLSISFPEKNEVIVKLREGSDK